LNKRLYIIVLLITGITFILSFYGEVLFSSNNILFNDSGDAIKNYFTYAYFIEHNGSCTNFEGMNHPYGEHFFYTDCHPILALTLKTLSGYFPRISPYSIGILNFFLIGSILITFLVIFRLLRELGLTRLFSLLFSISITLMAPQIFRIDGHFALSYSIAIPLTWLVFILSIKNPHRYGFIILLFFINALWLWTHLYLGAIISAFIITLAILKIVIPGDSSASNRIAALCLASIVISLVLTYSFIQFTDTHTGRTVNPSGFFLYNAEADDIFLPHEGPVRFVLDAITGNIIVQEWEARSYVGFSTLILFLVLLVLMIIYLFRPKSGSPVNQFFRNRMLNLSLLASILLLLFAMAIPFKQFPILLEYLPFLKQFRATGRFAWPFYFTATAFAALSFQTIFEDLYSRNKRSRGVVLIIVVLVLNVSEALPYHFKRGNMIADSPNFFKAELLPEDYRAGLISIDPHKYQAIIALPFYYYGSESYTRPRDPVSVRNSIIFSYHTGLPLVNADLTRTSIPESKKIVQLVSPDYYPKEIKADIQEEKAFLVIRSKSPLTQYEEELALKCDTVFSGKDFYILSLQLPDLFHSNSARIYKDYHSNKPAFYFSDPFYKTDSSSLVYYNNFEDNTSPISFRGNGAYCSVKRGVNNLASFNPDTFSAEVIYQVNLWMYNAEPDALNLWFRLILEEYDESTGEVFHTTYFPDNSETIFGDWSLVEGDFRVRDPKNVISIMTIGKEDSKASLYADDLLIIKAGDSVYRFDEEENSLFFNNHEIMLNK